MKSQTQIKNNSENPTIKVYYDGLCKVCSKEIGHYRHQRGSDRIEFIDICSPNFQAAQEGLDPLQVHKIMHVRRQDGSLATRVDAFIEIWATLPKYNWLARLAQRPWARAGLEVGYSGFSILRPYLPRYARAADCQDSPYCEVNNA